jgi:hypothetical protein
LRVFEDDFSSREEINEYSTDQVVFDEDKIDKMKFWWLLGVLKFDLDRIFL